MIPKGIIVHCSATPNGKSIGDPVKTITKWHTDPPRNWRTIGYHHTIDLNGEIGVGRGNTERGAHTAGKHPSLKHWLNETVGICMVGTDKFTGRQWESLRYCIDALLQIPVYNIKPHQIYCHNQFANKTCPGFSVNQLLAWYLTSDWDAVRDHLLPNYYQDKIL